MRELTGCIVAGLMVVGSMSMANVVVDFTNASATRDLSTSGDIITLDFSINGAGGVALDATPVGAGTDPEYLAAVESWDGLVGGVTDPALYGESFQITIFNSRLDRVTLDPLPAERLSVDGRYSNGIMGVGGGNGSRVDWTSGAQEILHFEQTGGTVQINLLDFAWHAASGTPDLWDTRLIAGGADNSYYNLPGSSGVVDVSALGYVIGSGANDLTFRQPLDGSHGLGIDYLTLEIVIPEPATTGLLALGAFAIMLTRRFRRHA